MAYWVKTPKWLKMLFPREMIWNMPLNSKPAVYITFDDGPHPVATRYAMEQLGKYNATATFFCIGKNVAIHPDIYDDLLRKGHATGNHTHNHVNGWKTDNNTYLDNILNAKQYINSMAFRPPYGRIKLSQAKRLLRSKPSWKIYMWDVLSGDFDTKLSPEKCLDNVLSNIEPGSIVVFHDSEKAWERMSYALPKVLAYCKQQHWEINALPIY
jgi:peptidoglycan-N-acetylglucosamine deacetylase